MKGNYLALVSLMLIFLFSSITIYSITFEIKMISSLTHVPLSSSELIISLSWVGGAVGGLVMGILADRVGKRKALLASILVFSLPILLNVPLLDEIFAFYVLWFLVGFGVNGDNGISYVYLAELAPPGFRSTLGSLMQGLYFLGAIVGAVLSSLAPIRDFLIIVGVLGLVGILLWFLIPESKFKGGKLQVTRVFDKENRRTTVLGSLFAIGSFLYLVPLVSLGDTMFLSYHFSRALSSLLITVALIVGMLSFLVSGRLADKFGKRRVTVALGIVAIASVLLFVTVGISDHSSLPVVYPVMMLASSFFSYFGVWISELYPLPLKGSGTNVTLFLGRLIGGGFGVSLVALLPFSLPLNLGSILLISAILIIVGGIGLKESS
jgi:MFS family permease